MSNPSWYWHRLRAMRLSEIGLHLRKKLYQWQDGRRLPECQGLKLVSASSFPKVAPPEAAQGLLRDALERDAKEILEGRCKAFGHLKIQVDTPPQWHADHLVRKNFSADQLAFKLI